MGITKLKVRLYGDPCLRKKAQAVKDVGASERMLIAAMIETMHNEQGVGLAAPQVGISSQIFVSDIGDGPTIFINPKIVKKSGSDELEEGCLSIPGIQVPVKRATSIVVQYVDENNQKQEKIFDELMARVIQHETDHLHGRLITDYASRDKLKEIEQQLKDLEENNS